MCLGYEKSREACVFLSDKLISNFTVFNNKNKFTLHYTTVFTSCAHQVSKYAYRMKQNVTRFRILIVDHCQWCV